MRRRCPGAHWLGFDMSKTKHVLVVEDDDSIRDYLQLALEDAGYDVIAAPNGAAALTLLDTTQPDLILLDMLMPIMNGWEFASVYRQRPRPHAPIVVVTAACDASARAEQIAAAGVLGKPFRLETLVSCVQGFTR